MSHAFIKRMAGGGRLRLRGVDYRTPYTYHVTWGTADRRPILSDGSLSMRLIEVSKEETRNTGMRLYAYCLMPDHLHVLFSPGNSG